MQAVAGLARQLARDGQKSVVWTIFTDTILELEKMLADLNPVTLYGAIPTGEEEGVDTRENRIRRFVDYGVFSYYCQSRRRGRRHQLA